MTALVTGGSGFIGAHVVRTLLNDGAAVRCLVRPGRPRTNLDGLAVELLEGHLGDPASLARAMRGVEVVFHCAADYRLGARDPEVLYRTNVEGTDRLLGAAAEAGVSRVVHTSSVGALGLVRGGVADEETPVSIENVSGEYKRSKYRAEQVALGWARRGLPVVIVNPAAPVGALDVKPTPTGKLILDYLKGRMKAVVDTGLNLIDVEDVARGHLLAAMHGKVGERYILGNQNLTLRQLFGLLEAVSGVRAPRLELPHWIPLFAAAVDETLARVLGREAQLSLESVRMSRERMFFSSEKAVRELGLPQSPIAPALARAVAWFRGHSYV